MSRTESPAELVERLRAEREEVKEAAPGLKLAIACGRNHFPRKSELVALSHLVETMRVVELHHGGAHGDRRFAQAVLAKHPQVRVVEHPALWREYGKSAGPLRTREMLTRVQALAVGPGGRGTEFAIIEARRQGRQVFFLEEVFAELALACQRDHLPART